MAQQQAEDQPSQQSVAGNANQTKINWPSDLQKISENNQADETIWLTVGNQKVLALKHWAKGKKFRGNAILLHAKEENPAHQRIIQPLAIQLSQLGWQVFIPSLPVEDFSNTINAHKNKITQSLPLNKSPAFFANPAAYQQHVQQTLSQLFSQIQPETGTLLLIANQNSAYWILDGLKNSTDIKQVVLLDPQVPEKVKTDVNKQISGQTLPIYAFICNEFKSQFFLEGFDRQLWRSKFLRINRSMLTNNSIVVENNLIAKTITGWIETQKKKQK